MKNYTIEQIDANNIRFCFTIPAAEYEKTLNTVFQVNRENYQIPGMRKGKADRKMVEAYLGREAFTKPALEKLVTEAYRKAASEYPEEIYYSPVVRVEQNEPGRDLVFSARVKINPETELCDYRSVRLTQEDLAEAEKALQGLSQEDREATHEYLLETALVNRIAAASQVEIPETMIHERALSMAQALERQLQNSQKSMEDYFEACHTTREKVIADFALAARDQLRSRLTLLAIARAEGLDATDEEYEAELKRLSDLYMMPVEKLKTYFALREGSKVRQDIAISKAAKFIGTLVREQCPELETDTKAEKQP